MVQIDTLVVHHLFGGAIELSFPDRFVDVSDFRPVPDHQEVFADGNLDQSLIVESLEHAAGVSDADVGTVVFRDLAAANDALSSQLDNTEQLPDTSIVLVSGQQQVSKGRQGPDASNAVHVLLCIVRLPAHATELVLSLNTPMHISPNSAAAEHAGAGTKGAHITAPDLFRRILTTLHVKDYGLFGG